jgi:hypothetical protein
MHHSNTKNVILHLWCESVNLPTLTLFIQYLVHEFSFICKFELSCLCREILQDPKSSGLDQVFEQKLLDMGW